MKKFAIASIMAVAAIAAQADSVTIEGQRLNTVAGADQGNLGIGFKHNYNNTFAADFGVSSTQTSGTDAVSTRAEVGVTASQPLPFGLTGSVRAGLGEKYVSTGNFTYYSVEPAVSAPIGSTGLTAKVGWRYRSAIDSTANNDQTHTMRYGVSYDLSKVDSVGVRYDRVRGDADQKVLAVNYTRSF